MKFELRKVIFNSKKYGVDENSDENIDKHYIIIYSYKYKGIKSFSNIKKDIKFIKKDEVNMYE